LRVTLFHHIIAPVTNMAAGVSPSTAQINFIVMSEPGATARNSDAVNAADMQISQPIGNLVHHACPRIGVRQRLNSIGQILKLLGIAKVGAAYREQLR